MSRVRFVVAIIFIALDLLLIFPIAGWMGWAATLAWLLGALLLGLTLLRATWDELAKLPRSGDLDRGGGETLARAAGFGLAGILLALPGILTDGAALLLLVPPIRRSLLRRLMRLAAIDPFESMTWGRKPGGRAAEGDAGQGGGRWTSRGNVRDVEFEILEDSPARPEEPQE